METIGPRSTSLSLPRTHSESGTPKGPGFGMSKYHEAFHDIYFDDLDAYRILHNARYVLLVERTIGSFWRSIGMNSALDLDSNPDQSHLVRQNHIEYLHPVIDTGRVRARIWIEKLGHSSLVFAFAILPTDSDKPYATGTRVLVRVDPETKRPAPWTMGFRTSVKPYVSNRSETNKVAKKNG